MLIVVEEVKACVWIPRHTLPYITQFSLPENWSVKKARLLQALPPLLAMLPQGLTQLMWGLEERRWLWIFGSGPCLPYAHIIQGRLKGKKEPPEGLPPSTVQAPL